jgi:serine/threonine-protein kinase CLA4
MAHSLYSPGQFMNPGPAPRPPTERPRLALTPTVSSLPGSMSNLNLQSNNASSTSLVRSKTEAFAGADSIVKEGFAKVKEDGGLFKSFVWNDRFLVLREHQVDFLKSQNNTKVATSINLRDVTNVTRSEVHPFSFEITRVISSGSGASPPRDGPSKSTICKVETENDVYSWIDAIYPRCPGMGGVSNPTNFTHRVHVGFDPVSGAFTGLPTEWERLLTASAITKEDYQKHPEAVVEVLNFFTEKMMKKTDDPISYPSPMPTPVIEPVNRQLGYSGSGSSIAGPRSTPSMQRQNTYESSRSDTFSPPSDKSYSTDRDQQSRMDEERRRRMDDEIRRKREQERKEQERREREELAAYNASLPKSRPPMSQQEIGGYSESRGDSRDLSGPRYNPSRPAPTAPMSPRDRQPPQGRPNIQAQRQAPSAPKSNGPSGYSSSSMNKPPTSVNGQRPPQSSSSANKYGMQNGSSNSRSPNNAQQQAQRMPGAQVPKPLNVQGKPPASSTQSEGVKKAEQALSRKEEGSGRKEVRMSSMSEAEVMAKLREVVSKERPLDSYNKQKKIGQGASGSVYVARIRENATSPTARKILRDNGPKAQVAIKQMDLRNQPRKELIVNEIIVMKDSKHENIVNFLDAFLQEEQSELWVVMEFMEGGALTDVIDNNPSISEDQIATVCLEVSLLNTRMRHSSNSLPDLQGPCTFTFTKYHPS